MEEVVEKMNDRTLERRNDIDWLRAFAVYVLFVFHVGKVFDKPPFYQIKNGELSELLGHFTGFIHIWHMPLFFLLAGWSVNQSLGKRSGGEFFKERVKRILLPLVLGIIVICPPLQFVYARTAMGFEGDYWSFVPLFFSSFDYFSWSHLWFLVYLLTFTGLYYWLFVRIGRREGSGRFRPGLLLVPIAVLIVIQVTLRPIWPGFQNLVDDWANFTFYSTFFIVGFLFARFPDYEALAHRHWKAWGIAGAAAALGILITELTLGYGRVALSFFAVSSYCIVMFLLGAAYQYARTRDQGLGYVRESAYPVYILHQASIVLPGYFIVQLTLPLVAKYFLLLAIAFGSTSLTYHFLVRPFNPVRWCFGMRVKRNA